MQQMKNMLKEISQTELGELGSVVTANDGRWIVGDDTLFPLQIEALLGGEKFLLYCTAMRSNGEPVYASLMKTLFVENLTGLSLGRYGISVGPVTLTIYQRFNLNKHFTTEKLAAMLACHRMLMECYLEGDKARLEEMPVSKLLSLMDNTILPFRH